MKTTEMQLKELHKAFIALKEEVSLFIKKLNEEEDKPLTESEVMKMLDISKKTIRSYRKGKILAYSQIGNKFFYKKSDINNMLNEAYFQAEKLD